MLHTIDIPFASSSMIVDGDPDTEAQCEGDEVAKWMIVDHQIRKRKRIKQEMKKKNLKRPLSLLFFSFQMRKQELIIWIPLALRSTSEPQIVHSYNII